MLRASQEPVLFTDRGRAYDGIGRYQDALGDYDRAIARAPTDPVAYFNRGNAYFALGNTQRVTAG